MMGATSAVEVIFEGRAEEETVTVRQADNPATITKEHSDYGPNGSLQNLIGKFEKGIFRRTVNEGAAEGIADHHDDCPDGYPDTGCQRRAAT